VQLEANAQYLDDFIDAGRSHSVFPDRSALFICYGNMVCTHRLQKLQIQNVRAARVIDDINVRFLLMYNNSVN
jgi:hypothetical protein